MADWTRSTKDISRYQREQRITMISWAVLLSVIAILSTWAHYASRAVQSGSPDNAAAPTPAPSMSAWLTKSKPSINHLVVARNNIAAAAAHHDIVGTGAACRSATGAVAELHQQLPSPVQTLNNSLLQAVDSYEVGLPYCISASQTQDAEVMRRATGYITRGDAAMRFVLDILGSESDTDAPNLGMLIV